MTERDLRTRRWITALNLLFMTIATVVVLVGLYVFALGQLLALLPERRADVAQWLSTRLDMRVEIDRIDAGVEWLTPVVSLQGVRLYVKDTVGPPALAAPLIDLQVAALRSLVARQPVLDLLRIEGIDLVIEETEDGRYRVKGMPFRVNDPDAAEKLRQALRVLYAQRRIVVERARIGVESPRLPFASFEDIRIHMRNDGESHAVAGSTNVQGQGRLPLSFVLQFQGEPLRPADMIADLYLRVAPASLEGWLPRRDVGDAWIDALAGGGEAWLRLDRGVVHDVRGRVQVDSMSASLGDGSKVEGVLGLTTRFRWQGTAREWTLALGQLNFRRQGRAWPETDVAVSWRRDDAGQSRVQATVTRGSIDMLAALVPVLPTSPALERLARIAPRGQLGNLRLRWESATETVAARWQLATDFSQAGWQPDAGLPGVQGLSGRIEATPDSGLVTLASQGLALDWPTLFEEKLALDELALRLAWKRAGNDWHLRSDRFTLRNPDARASGLFSLQVPADGASPELQLLGLIEDGNGAMTARYLPLNTSPGVRQWLAAALKAGRLERGSFLFNGPVRREPAELLARRTFQMRYQGSGITLAFLPEWPALQQADADVFIANGRVDARGRAGRLLDSALTAIYVDVTPVPDAPSKLSVQARLDGDLADAFRLFRETPLRTSVPAELLRWNGSGRLGASVQVLTTLGEGARPRVTVAGEVSGGALDSAAHELGVGDVSGRLRYDSVDGFSASELRGTALGSVLTGSARTLQGTQTLVELRGRLRMQPLNDWLRLPVLDLLRGESDASLTLRFNAGGDAGMDVRSDLRGISSAAPAPLAKSAETAVDTALGWTLGTDKPRLQLTYGRALAADVFIENRAPVRGVVSLGNTRLPALAEGRGLVVEGEADSLSIPDWLVFVRRMLGAPPVVADGASAAQDTPATHTVAGVAALGDYLQRMNIRVDRMDTGGLSLDNAALRLTRAEGVVRVAVSSTQLDGALQIPADYRAGDQRPLDLQIARLSLSANALAAAGGGSPLSPRAIPRLRVVADNLRIGNQDYGAWSLDAVPQADGVRFDDVQGKWRAMELKGKGAWREQEGGQLTEFSGAATAPDIARVSEAFGFQPNLSSAAAKFDFDLAWTGRPDDIDIDRVKGFFDLDLRDGRFVTASARSQALRAFGVFNVSTWQRRMKLDFTDLYKRGVAFDTLTGRVQVDAGRLATEDLVARGPSAMFELQGSTHIASHALDTRVRVTLPVNSNLYVGCLAGLAACAGIVAFEQLWGDRLEKLTTLGYEVKGSWEDPQVRQIESAAPAAPASKG